MNRLKEEETDLVLCENNILLKLLAIEAQKASPFVLSMVNTYNIISYHK